MAPIHFLISILIVIVIFLIFRALILWYWKIDKIVKLLEIIAHNLEVKLSKSEEEIKTVEDNNEKTN
jgi:predicted Holliday junction resolvase-like endonuclease